MRFLASLVVLALPVLAAAESAPESPALPSAQSEMDDRPQVIDGRPSYFMFIQSAVSGSFKEIDQSGERYELILENVSPTTMYFSDRPARISGHVPMQKFLDGLGFSEENPPNAAIEVNTGDGTSDVVVAELLNPRWDDAARRLTYEIRILKDATDGGLANYNDRKTTILPARFGSAAVFIDDCPDKVVHCFARRGSCPVGGLALDPCQGVDQAGSYCGALDGKKGTCWNFATAACRLCRNYFSECDEAYPAPEPTDCDYSMFGLECHGETSGCGNKCCGHTFSTNRDGSHAGEIIE